MTGITYIIDVMCRIGLYCIQITFQSGWTAVLNRQNFEWNATPLSQIFRETQSATDFISLFREKAKFDPRKGFIALCSPVTSTREVDDTLEEEDTSTHSEDDLSPPSSSKSPSHSTSPYELGRKRTQSESAGPLSKTMKPTDLHYNPLDDSIHAKRVGMSL